jgi:hypothetical protein
MAMSEPRLATEIWVAAYLLRLRQAAIPAFLTARGDDGAGAVLVKVATLDGGAALYARQYDLHTDRRTWIQIEAGPEADVDAALGRERQRDPDLWIIEVEDKAGRSLLDEPGVGE